MKRIANQRGWAAGMLAAALLFCTMVPALAGSFTVSDSTGASIQLQIVQEEDDIIDLDEYDVPYGLPETPACHTHDYLLAAALGLGIVYTVILIRGRKKVLNLQQQLKEAGNA